VLVAFSLSHTSCNHFYVPGARWSFAYYHHNLAHLCHLHISYLSCKATSAWLGAQHGICFGDGRVMPQARTLLAQSLGFWASPAEDHSSAHAKSKPNLILWCSALFESSGFAELLVRFRKLPIRHNLWLAKNLHEQTCLTMPCDMAMECP
jgi:hypothetical protein